MRFSSASSAVKDFGFFAALGFLLLAIAACPTPAPAAQDSGAALGIDRNQALAFSQSVIGKPVGDYVLTDRYGRRVQLSDYRGKPLVVNFVYTGCFQVCPTATRFLAKAVKSAQDALGPDAFVTLTIGFNQPFDTPQAMDAFAKEQGIDLPNWVFLSPDEKTVLRLTRDLGFSFKPTPKGFDHITQVTIIDPAGRVYRQVYGNPFELPMLVEPLKQLIAGASSPAPGLTALFDKVRLFCTVYDPDSGTYRLNYSLFIEIFIGATLLGAVAYFMVREYARGRRSSACGRSP